MVVSGLADGLRNVFNKITRAPIMSEQLRETSLKELQRTLIMSDVDVKLVMEFTNGIRERLKTERLSKGLSNKEFFIKIVYEELVALMGKEHQPEIKSQRILMVGTYGHGKTSTTAKLAKFYTKRGLKTVMITTDTWRPAAYEQLRQLGEKIGVNVYGEPESKDAMKILKNGLKKYGDTDVIIVDSAGRDSLNDELITEIKALHKELKPDQSYLILGADMGQTASKQAEEFNSAIGLTGIIVTRMDSSAKGGGALSACAKAGVPVTFLGIGEKLEDLDIYDPQRYVSRLLGYGDLPALMEKVKEVAEEENLNPEELLEGEFTLKKFYKQMEATKKMGSFSKILEQLGVGNQVKKEDIAQSEEKMKTFKYMMDSMTEKELEDPDLIDKKRVARIAKGSGCTPAEVRELLKQFKLTKKVFKKFKGKKRMPRNLQRMMGKMGMGGMGA
ncbi:signal recognition particle receptor subunit alpha [archaeon]|nr:signal recognition particle receptor subunit alpha [archaeon]